MTRFICHCRAVTRALQFSRQSKFVSLNFTTRPEVSANRGAESGRVSFEERDKSFRDADRATWSPSARGIAHRNNDVSNEMYDRCCVVRLTRETLV